MNALQILIGLSISKIEKVQDYIQIIFLDGSILSIFNSYVYDGKVLKDIEGKSIMSTEESKSFMIIHFNSGHSLSVGLNEDDFNGPEAMTLKQDGKPLVVMS